MEESSDVSSHVLAVVQSAWNAAARDWNIEALTDMYTADALFYGGRPGHSIGSDAIREYFASYKSVVKSATLDLVDQNVIRLNDECFLTQGYGDLIFELTSGNTASTRLRKTLVVAPRHDTWKIRQHHFSATPEAPPV